ncbi:MAG: hypothetical protein BJ554DRAFT_4632 [Olpidium bornovanus]|uniref:Na+/H+ antiporter NhaC-like C-terminal domain-containing protein n=1 Tax=Olpidium bornovanus TaxID=278681 RepID=A0A8H7ZLX4_9FUNG|nr:MAG: hypothetical protein BJ554DRAFT_4632 [Olpidium bornovanus]
MTFRESMDTWLCGIKDIVDAFMTLTLAVRQSCVAARCRVALHQPADKSAPCFWSLSEAVEDMGTGIFITSVFKENGIVSNYVPALIFVVSCAISFCSGTSWFVILPPSPSSREG